MHNLVSDLFSTVHRSVTEGFDGWRREERTDRHDVIVYHVALRLYVCSFK